MKKESKNYIIFFDFCQLISKFSAELLAHLLLLNYQFSNNKYHNISANEIFKNLHKIKYSKKDLEQIKNNAIALLDIKYNIRVNNL